MTSLTAGLAIWFALFFTVHADSGNSYIVGLRTTSNGQNYCAGALISPKYVLTSNKCYPAMIGFNDGPTYEAQYAVIGSKYLKGSNDGETIKVSNQIRHTEFSIKMNEYDFLLLELESTSSRTPATMVPVSGPFIVGGNTTVMGWGAGESLSTMKMAITRTSFCDGFEDLDDWDLCLKSASETTSCKFDYGSPVITTVTNGSAFLNGVVKNVSICQQSNSPIKADNLGPVRNWIKLITGR